MSVFRVCLLTAVRGGCNKTATEVRWSLFLAVFWQPVNHVSPDSAQKGMLSFASGSRLDGTACVLFKSDKLYIARLWTNCLGHIFSIYITAVSLSLWSAGLTICMQLKVTFCDANGVELWSLCRVNSHQLYQEAQGFKQVKLSLQKSHRKLV